MSKVFGIIKVAATRPSDQPLHLNFVSRDAYDDTLRRIQKSGRTVTDSFWGYKLYTSADDAIGDVEVFIR
jgi:uncharacterized glyoxalase superfamily protein PhnB